MRAIIFFSLFIEGSFLNNLENNKLFSCMEAVCQNDDHDFHLAIHYFFDEKWDSAYYFSNRVSEKLSNSDELSDYNNYINGVSASQKKFYSIAKSKLTSIPDSFKFNYLVWLKLGAINLNQNEAQKSVGYFKRFLEANKITSGEVTAKAFHDLGSCYLLLHKYDSAKWALDTALKVSSSIRDTLQVICNKLDLGNVYYNQYQDNKAILLFEEAYALACEFYDLNVRQTIAYNLATIEKDRGNYKKSVEYYIESSKLKDSIWNRDKISLLLEKDKQKAIALKEKEVQAEKEKVTFQKKQRNWFIVSSGIFLLLSTLLVLLYKAISKQKELLNKSNRLKDYLFSVVSHDLRAPLNFVKDRNEKIKEALAQGNESLAFEMAQENQVISENTVHLLNNVLNWTLKENGQLSYSPDMHPISILIKGGLYDFYSLAENKGIKIREVLNDECVVIIDKELFKIVFRNLIDNAIKYTPENGEITVEVKKRGDACDIWIKDNGAGMPEDILLYANQKQDLSKEKINRSKGVGLGLILCKNLTEMNKGTLHFENRDMPERGLTVKMTLPITKN